MCCETTTAAPPALVVPLPFATGSVNEPVPVIVPPSTLSVPARTSIAVPAFVSGSFDVTTAPSSTFTVATPFSAMPMSVRPVASTVPLTLITESPSLMLPITHTQPFTVPSMSIVEPYALLFADW